MSLLKKLDFSPVKMAVLLTHLLVVLSGRRHQQNSHCTSTGSCCCIASGKERETAVMSTDSFIHSFTILGRVRYKFIPRTHSKFVNLNMYRYAYTSLENGHDQLYEQSCTQIVVSKPGFLFWILSRSFGEI